MVEGGGGGGGGGDFLIIVELSPMHYFIMYNFVLKEKTWLAVKLACNGW